MPIFATDRIRGVQSFILQVVNHNCAEVDAKRDGPRLEGRVNLVVPVVIVPVERGELFMQQAFTAVTKEFSTTGLAVVLDHARAMDEVIIGLRWEGVMTYLRAKARHLNPMGGGFFQVGFRAVEMICPSDHPGLESVTL